MKVVFAQVKSKVIEFFRKILHLRATPNQIASGFAVGVFIGILPTLGLGGLIILAIAPMVKFNVPAAFLGTLVGNPFFGPAWIALTCLVTGISVEDIKLPQETFQYIIGHYSQIGLRFLLGSFGLSLFFAVISYFVLVRFVHWYRARKQLHDQSTE